MSSSRQFWKEIVSYQITFGSISFVASTLIVSFIALNGLSTPYRRIIFGLSVSDMIKSFALVAGPFLIQADAPRALWGIGNEFTCRIDGFLYHLGVTAVPMYTVFLCVYYVYKLKNRMTDAQFTQRIEKKVHAVIIVINLVLYLLALGMDLFAPTFFGNYCCATNLRTCEDENELGEECDESEFVEPSIVRFFRIWSYWLVPVSSIIGITVSMGLIFWDALIRERMFGIRRNDSVNTLSSIATRTGEDTTIGQNTSDHTDSINASITSNADAESLSRLYKKELLTQICCYVMVFCMISLPFIIFVIVGKDHVSDNHLRSMAILTPIGGFFNIIVYTRWNVRSWRRSHPECSWLRAFLLVLSAGGDLPKEDFHHEAGDGCVPNQNNNHPAALMASEQQFGLGLETSADVQVCSGAVVIDEKVLSGLEEISSSQWSYVKGGSSSSMVSKSRLGVTSSATTIRHANRGGDSKEDT